MEVCVATRAMLVSGVSVLTDNYGSHRRFWLTSRSRIRNDVLRVEHERVAEGREGGREWVAAWCVTLLSCGKESVLSDGDGSNHFVQR